MKHLYYILLVVMFLPFCVVGQQNLVPNPSFEQYVNCPTSISNVTSDCVGWHNFNMSASSDYYNTCKTSAPNVPNGLHGYQPANFGNAYVGFQALNQTAGYFKESLCAKLLSPLQVGGFYEVSMYLNTGNNSNYSSNNVDVFFFKNGDTTTTSTAAANIIPQVRFTSHGSISDTQNWVRVSEIFLADSAYTYMALGGFFYNATSTQFQTGGVGIAYYYADSVSVKVVDTLLIALTDTLLCAGDTINVSYISWKKKQTNNVFTLQLSDASGSFVTPVNIGYVNSDTSGTVSAVIPTTTPTGTAYRMRIVASNYPDTSEVSIKIKIGNTVSKPVANSNSPVCENDTLRFTAMSSTSGVSYKWTGPAGFMSAVQNPIINNPVTANSGDYIVTAYLYGCEAMDTTTAIVYGGSGPGGALAVYNSPICAGDTLRLFGAANGIGNTYSWSGPNSFTSNLQNPILPNSVASMSGDYVVYANNGNCASRDTISVLIKPRPANFNASSNSPVCTGATINFTASSTSTGVTYAWSGPNGFNSTNATPFINGSSFVHNGDYYITGTLNGCALSDTLPVVVKPLPIKPVANSNTPLCAGEGLQLTVGSSTGSSFGWTGPASFTSSIQNPTISNTTTAMSGDYIVTIDSNGCINKDTTAVLVKPMPTAVTTSSNSPVCAGSTLQLSSTASTTGVSYTWTGPGSYTASTQNTSIVNSIPTATGWYKMSVDLNGCSIIDSTYATVNAIPATPSISFNSQLCVGETLNLNASSVNGATYSWTGANNFTSSVQNPTKSNMQFGDTGTYKVTASANGCTSPADSVKVNLNANPFVVILANPADSICQGDPVVFTALPNNHGGTPSYQWKVNTQSVGTGIVFNTTTLNDGDVILCEMTENTKCSVPYKDESNDVQMTVLPWLAPSVTITASPNHPLDEYEYITFTAVVTNAGKNPTYQWKRNGNDIVGATGSIWSANTLNDNDSVSVEIISSYKCPQPTTAVSNWIRVRTTGVEDIDGFGALVLYPNPNRGKFVIKASPDLSRGEMTNCVVEVINTLGQVVHSEQVATANGLLYHEIDMGNVAGGVYMLRVKGSDGRVGVLRFMVE